MVYGEVYVVTCSVNGKQYVGQTTCGAEKRWVGHQEQARGGRGHLLAKAIRKYGIDTFSMKVVAVASSQDELNSLEVEWILKVVSRVPNGYNLSEGGGRGKHAPESIERMRVRRSPETCEKLRKNNLGKTLPPEVREKIRLGNLGKKRSPETREKIRQARLGHTYSPETLEKIRLENLGKKASPETLEKTRIASTGRKHSEATREKLRVAGTGRRPSIETRARMSLSARNRRIP